MNSFKKCNRCNIEILDNVCEECFTPKETRIRTEKILKKIKSGKYKSITPSSNDERVFKINVDIGEFKEKN